MTCDEYIFKYLISNFSTLESIKMLRENSLYIKFADKFAKKDNKKLIEMNRLFNSFNITAARNILGDIETMHTEYIIFKGFVLSQRLYGSPDQRIWGDIDFYVKSQYFDKVYFYLLKKGYELTYKDGLSNPHHVGLKKGGKLLELHRTIFHPKVEINEDFLRKNLQHYIISDSKNTTFEVTTFNETATILHLIYHLYMDTYFASFNLKSIFTSRKLPKARRFLYRAYEIALFSEKYYCKINWTDIQNDLTHQKFRIFFKKMILDIIEIFPNAFPESFLNTVFRLNYIGDERDELYRCFMKANDKETSKNTLLCDYINNKWLARREKNISKKVGDSITLNKASKNGSEYDLSCFISTEKSAEGLNVVFKVSNDDFCISERNDYNTMISDGVHLLLCGTEEYSYNSIFFFPKEIDGNIEVIPYDALNNETLSDDLIKAEFTKTENEYCITAGFSNEFLQKNHLNLYLYLGLVISDCSSHTHYRKNSLILSEEDSQWYNPIYFAKFDMA